MNEINFLTADEKQKLLTLVGSNCQASCISVVRLYTTGTNSLTWQLNGCGILCFVKDKHVKSYFIRVYDIFVGFFNLEYILFY